VERLAPLEEAVGEPVDDRCGLRGGPAREQPQEILELRRKMEDAAGLGQEERPGAELVDREEPAACALVPEGEGERPAETAEGGDPVACERRGGENLRAGLLRLAGLPRERVRRQQAPREGATDRTVDGKPRDARTARVAGRERALEPG
jgi:hypothetical protein